MDREASAVEGERRRERDGKSRSKKPLGEKAAPAKKPLKKPL
jgi:hypothetical protein